MVGQMRTSIYKLGQIYIQIQMPKRMPIPENMEKFCVKEFPENKEIQRYYFIEYTDEISKIEQQFEQERIPGKEAKRDNLVVFQTKQGEFRRISFHGAKEAYAVSLVGVDGTCHTWADIRYGSWMQFETVFVSMLALEKEMMHAGAMLLHSAFMRYKDTAVLFSAASGTGKSTQADLWTKYRGTKTVNGDRSLLVREAEGWRAYGWPICGSSEICHNENYPVRAIVMLKQAKENRIYPLKGFAALRAVMEQITINAWDSDFQNVVIDQLEHLLQEVPVYCLECDISEEAVNCLEQVLVSEG